LVCLDREKSGNPGWHHSPVQLIKIISVLLRYIVTFTIHRQ
jgi:hypothetical protein